jgi:abhydrolase domain-containing protein 17
MIYDWFREVARRLQVNVMAYDYSGYGLSEGEPSEEAVYSDAEAAFAYLVNVKKASPNKIILYVARARTLSSKPA